MAHSLTTMSKTHAAPAHASERLDHAVQQLRTASTPLLQLLSPDERSAATGEDPG
jgi:hypothetical protein